MSAGMDMRIRPGSRLILPALHPIPFWSGLSIRLSLSRCDDSSVMGSCAYPYSTLLGGILDRIPGYRLLFPLHTDGCQATRMGKMLSPPYLRGGNYTHTKTKLSKIPATHRHLVCLSHCIKKTYASFRQTKSHQSSIETYGLSGL